MHPTDHKCKKHDLGIYCAHMLQRNVNYLLSWPFFHCISFHFFLFFMFHPRYSPNIFWCWLCIGICILYVIRNVSYIALHFTASDQCILLVSRTIVCSVYECMCVSVYSYSWICTTHRAASFFCAVHTLIFHWVPHFVLCIWTVRTLSLVLLLFTFVVEFETSVAEAHELFDTNQIRLGCRSDRLHFYLTLCSFSCGSNCLLHQNSNCVRS